MGHNCILCELIRSIIQEIKSIWGDQIAKKEVQTSQIPGYSRRNDTGKDGDNGVRSTQMGTFFFNWYIQKKRHKCFAAL
jgi:hypothetical protein